MSASSKPRVTLWVTRRHSVPDSSLRQRLLPRLSPSERQRLAAIRTGRKQQEYLLSRALMRHALGSNAGLPWNRFSFTECRGFPDIAPYPGNTHLSLSHSGGLVCFTVATVPTGVDVEPLNRIHSIEHQRYLNSDDDRTLLAGCDRLAEHERFLFSWCAREAWFKADISHRNETVLNLPLARIAREPWHSYLVRMAGHLCVVSTAGAATLDVLYCTPLHTHKRVNPQVARIAL